MQSFGETDALEQELEAAGIRQDKQDELSEHAGRVQDTPDETPDQNPPDGDHHIASSQTKPRTEPTSSSASQPPSNHPFPLPRPHHTPKQRPVPATTSPNSTSSARTSTRLLQPPPCTRKQLSPNTTPSFPHPPPSALWPPNWQWRHWKSLSDLWHSRFDAYNPSHSRSEPVYNRAQMGAMIVDRRAWQADPGLQVMGRSRGREWILLKEVAVQLYDWEVLVVRDFTELLDLEARALRVGEREPEWYRVRMRERCEREDRGLAEVQWGRGVVWTVEVVGKRLAALKKQEAFSRGGEGGTGSVKRVGSRRGRGGGRGGGRGFGRGGWRFWA